MMNLRFIAILLLALLPASVHSATRIFYDGFETGNSNLWSQEGSNARCPVVSGSADGLQGPRAGSYMLRCNWISDGNSSGSGTIEALARNGTTSEYNSEVLWRWWFRRDSSLNGGTGPKLFRIATGSSFGDLMVNNSATTGSFEAAIFDANGSTFCRYWGVDTAGNLAWHKIELYIYAHPSSGIVRMWVDGAMVKECTGMNLNVPGNDSFYGYNMSWTSYIFPSNWSGAAGCCAHDATNYAYWDDFEIYSDSSSGTPATGSLANATVSVSGGGTTYTVTPSAGANGTISPNTAQTINSGSTTQFTVTPSGGYTASAGGTCGGSLVGTTYTTNAIVADCTVSATFAGDTTPPVISAPLPAGEQPYGTSSVTLQVTTNEAATCKYHLSDVAYASMASTFASTGGTTHQQTGFATSNGSAYTRYVRCIDASGNASASSASISFSVAATTDELIIDNTGAGVTQSGGWSASTYYPGYYGSNYHYAPDETGHWFQWSGTLAPGTYQVHAQWPATATRPNESVYQITHSGGTANVAADQTANGGQWNLLGAYAFDGASTVRLLSSANGTDGTAADAIRFSISTSDITPPALSGLSPTGDQATPGTSIALALTTDENATCRYNLNGVSDYDLMSNYTTTGGTSHSATVTVRKGGIYAPAAKCRDAAGNTSASPAWRFAIPDSPKRRLMH